MTVSYDDKRALLKYKACDHVLDMGMTEVDLKGCNITYHRVSHKPEKILKFHKAVSTDCLPSSSVKLSIITRLEFL